MHSTKFLFSFDTRNSFIRNREAKIGGIKTGLEFKGKWRFGLGYYFLNPPLDVKVPIKQHDIVVPGKLYFNYGALYAEYVLFGDKKWEFSLPIQLGTGITKIEHAAPDNSTRQIRRRRIWIAEPTIIGHYKFLSWVGIGAGVGYRKMLNKDDVIQDVFDSPIYIIKLKLFVGNILKCLKKKEK